MHLKKLNIEMPYSWEKINIVLNANTRKVVVDIAVSILNNKTNGDIPIAIMS